MMNRRAFLQRLSAGVVSAFVVAKLPTSWIPEPVRSRAACEFLRREYHAFTKGRWKNHPQVMTAGRELYDAYAAEITACERFTDTNDVIAGRESLKFKAVTLRPVGRGWRVECHLKDVI